MLIPETNLYFFRGKAARFGLYPLYPLIPDNKILFLEIVFFFAYTRFSLIRSFESQVSPISEEGKKMKQGTARDPLVEFAIEQDT